MSEDVILAALSADNVKATTEHICREIPSRLAGSENGRRMAEYSAQRLGEVGVDAKVHEFPGLVSFPGPAGLRVLSPQEMAVEANTLGHSVPTEGISGELLYVGSGAFQDYEGKDPVGKIILTELSYAPSRYEKQRIAGIKGAIGAVMMNWGAPDNAAVPFGTVKPAWGNPTPETFESEMPVIPCIGIARTDGLKLKAMCEQGPVRVRLRANVENGWRPVQITVGEIPSSISDDFVIVAGHQDSWPGPAATDNAAGSGCILELARVFSEHRDKLRRGLTCAFWTGHETGTMVGSTWYVDQNWDRLREHLTAYLQIDQPACTGTTRWGTGSNVELRRFHQAVESRILGNSREFFWHRQKKHGDCSFFGLGVPMLYGMGHFTEEQLKETALANWGWWHHSLECTLDKVDFEWMKDHIRMYGAYLWELCTMHVLPYEFVGAADQFIERLTQLQADGSAIRLDGALERAKSFREAAVRFDALAEKWRAYYRKNPTADDGPAEILNKCMKRVSRLVVPISSTVKGTYGHDPYGLTAQAAMLPCLYEIPRMASLPKNSEERWMLETKLVRERNRVADTLGDARTLLGETMDLQL